MSCEAVTETLTCRLVQKPIIVLVVVHLFANKTLGTKNAAGYQKRHQSTSKLAVYKY